MKILPTPDKKDLQLSREEQIRVRAYELFEQHGRHEGNDLEDWLEAEAEILEADARAVA
jgi:hypothetical protein